MRKIDKFLAIAILASGFSGVATSCSSDNNDEANTIQTGSESLTDEQALAWPIMPCSSIITRLSDCLSLSRHSHRRLTLSRDPRVPTDH